MTEPSPQRRIYHADRKHAMRHLEQAVADGRLDLEDFEEFSGVIARTEDLAELTDLVRRVQSLSTTGVPVAVPLPGPVGLHPESKTAWFADIKRTGQWQVRDGSSYTVNLGTLFLDLRQAQASTPTVRLDLNIYLGSARLVVSPGVVVESQLEVILSDEPKITVAPPVPGAARIILSGRVFLGDVKVISRQPEERLPLGFKKG